MSTTDTVRRRRGARRPDHLRRAVPAPVLRPRARVRRQGRLRLQHDRLRARPGAGHHPAADGGRGARGQRAADRRARHRADGRQRAHLRIPLRRHAALGRRVRLPRPGRAPRRGLHGELGLPVVAAARARPLRVVHRQLRHRGRVPHARQRPGLRGPRHRRRERQRRLVDVRARHGDDRLGPRRPLAGSARRAARAQRAVHPGHPRLVRDAVRAAHDHARGVRLALQHVHGRPRRRPDLRLDPPGGGPGRVRREGEHGRRPAAGGPDRLLHLHRLHLLDLHRRGGQGAGAHAAPHDRGHARVRGRDVPALPLALLRDRRAGLHQLGRLPQRQQRRRLRPAGRPGAELLHRDHDRRARSSTC